MTNKTHYIYSTLTASNTYTRTRQTENDLPLTDAAVTIRGGTNIPDKHLITPYGVMTAVNDEELAVLQESEVFQLHVKNGFIKVEAKQYDPETVAADMPTRDQSSPLVLADYEATPNVPHPVTNSSDQTDAPKPANKRRA